MTLDSRLAPTGQRTGIACRALCAHVARDVAVATIPGAVVAPVPVPGAVVAPVPVYVPVGFVAIIVLVASGGGACARPQAPGPIAERAPGSGARARAAPERPVHDDRARARAPARDAARPAGLQGGSPGERLSVWLQTVSQAFVVAEATGERRCAALAVQRAAPRLDRAPEGDRLAADHRLGRGRLAAERERFGETWRGRVGYRIADQAVTFLAPELRRVPLSGEPGHSPEGCGSPARPVPRRAAPRGRDAKARGRAPASALPRRAAPRGCDGTARGRAPASALPRAPAPQRPRSLASGILAVEPQRVRLAAGTWFAGEARCEAAARKPSARRFAWAALGLALPPPPEWIRDPSKDWLRRRIRAKGKVWFVVHKGRRKVCEEWQLLPEPGTDSTARLERSVRVGMRRDTCRLHFVVLVDRLGRLVGLRKGVEYFTGRGCPLEKGGSVGRCLVPVFRIHAMSPTHATIGQAGWYFDRKTCLAARARETGRDSPDTWHGAP